MKKRISVLMIFVMVMSTLMLGCSKTPGGTDNEKQNDSSTPVSSEKADTNSEKKLKVGFSIQDISNPTWSEMYEHMEAKADELGIEITLSDCQADPAKQITSLENFIEGGYDAIIVHCFDAESASQTIQKAKDKGIKILAYDTDLELADCYYGLDNYEVGKQIAKNAADFINATFEDGKCEIGVCNYPLNQVCLDRAEGIKDGLAEYVPNAEVVAEAQAGYTDEGIVVGENFMQAHPNMKVVVGIDDAGLLGVYEAVKAAGKEKDSDFGMFGIDAVEEALKLIEADTAFRSTIFLDLNTTGGNMVQAAYDLLNGKTVERNNYFPMVNITKDNAGEYISK